jgi:hypothetical protein
VPADNHAHVLAILHVEHKIGSAIAHNQSAIAMSNVYKLVVCNLTGLLLPVMVHTYVQYTSQSDAIPRTCLSGSCLKTSTYTLLGFALALDMSAGCVPAACPAGACTGGEGCTGKPHLPELSARMAASYGITS